MENGGFFHNDREGICVQRRKELTFSEDWAVHNCATNLTENYLNQKNALKVPESNFDLGFFCTVIVV